MRNRGGNFRDEGALADREKIDSPARILVVDDDHHMREIMARALYKSGYKHVDKAVDGADAWKALHEESYYLVITDHQMPRVTGLELIRKMRSADMRQPVILVSGTIPTEELEQNPELRVDAILAKPITAGELVSTVEKVLPITGRIPTLKDNKIIQAEEAAIVPTEDQRIRPAVSSW